MTKVTFHWPEELLGQVDLVRGDVPRNRWVQRAIERELDKTQVVRRPEIVEGESQDQERAIVNLQQEASMAQLVQDELAGSRREIAAAKDKQAALERAETKAAEQRERTDREQLLDRTTLMRAHSYAKGKKR